ncbi:Helix-turn-helix domain [Phytophthora infestans]|nr:Helix-turn-helix domain [Phytophthora infestans]
MTRAVWLTDEQREKIVQMRNDGMPVKDIAEQMRCSTNYIYRVLRKANSTEPNKKKQRISDSNAPASNAAAASTVAQRTDVEEGRDQLLEDLTDSSASLLCAVDSMEVSAYDPIPMPKSVRGAERRAQSQVRQDAVNASVAFGADANVNCNVAKPQAAQSSEEFWLLPDAAPSTCRPGSPMSKTASSNASRANQVQLQSLTRQKSRASTKTTSAPATSSSLLVSLHVPRSRSELTHNSRASPDGLNDILKLIKDEIRRLEGMNQSDIYDAQLLQMLVKFHAEMLLVQLQKTLSVGDSSKRARDEGKETNRLLRQKLAKEIALLNVQADRERLELEREQIRHKTTSMICRKTLLDANASPIDVDQLFPRN